jgi:hypothetical protein
MIMHGEGVAYGFWSLVIVNIEKVEIKKQ